VRTFSQLRLEVERPPKLRQLFLDVGKRQLQRGTSMRARGSLREDSFPLHLKRLLTALLFRVLKLAVLNNRLGSGSLCLLLLNGFTFPSTRHEQYSTPLLADGVK